MSLFFVVPFVGAILLLRKRGFFDRPPRDVRKWAVGLAALGMFGTIFIEMLSRGTSPVGAFFSAVALTIVGAGIIAVLLELRR